MRIFIFTLLWLLPGLCSRAQSFTLNVGGTNEKGYFTVIPYENIKGKIIIPVSIQGKTYRFILDTGAPNSISSALAEVLKPTLLNKIPVTDQSGKTDSMEVVALSAVMLGDVAFTNIPSLVSESPIFSCTGYDGLIGSNLLRNSIVRFSSRDKTITITDDRSRLDLKKKHASALKLTASQSNPYFKVVLTGKKKVSEYLLFDSGADNIYDLCMEHYKVFKPFGVLTDIIETQGASTMGFHGIADNAPVCRVKIPAMDINGAILNNISAETTNDDNSRIGARLLEYGIVTVDYLHRKFYFEPFQPSSDLHEKQAGFSTSFSNGKYIIGVIWDEQLKPHMHTGDQIISVDGIDHEHITLCDLLNKESVLKTKDKATIVLKDKNSALHTLQVEKK